MTGEALGDFLVLRLRDSGGTAVSVTEHDMMCACEELAAKEGLLVAPEGGVCIAAWKKLRQSGFLGKAESNSHLQRGQRL